ncbi:hypothetical protein HPB51_017694 [Rhipicephalus microplus]|uniref:Uncharacterized protein n=1 Tax=Rhipicephalus microplus TaxID=6941 RepID=A0A9J6E3F4_RHIMP|nr:hypothetical protein HPB51_017694 [Rhipicephalus microplus]
MILLLSGYRHHSWLCLCRCCPMDRALIQGIKRLRVLTPYDYENMDELVQDLTSALEESSSSAQHCHPSQRKWCSKKALLPLDPARLPGSVSSSTTCQTTRSAISGDDSESSLEGRALSGMDQLQVIRQAKDAARA